MSIGGTSPPAFQFLTMYLIGYGNAMFSIRLTQEFSDWLDALPDRRAQARIAARLRQVEAGSLGDWQPVSGEVS